MENFEWCTFDLSDNSPRVYFNLFFQPIKIHSKNFWEEKQERKLKNIRFLSLKTPIKSRFLYGRNYQTVLNFRVSHLRPLGQLSVCFLNCSFFELYFAKKRLVNNWRKNRKNYSIFLAKRLYLKVFLKSKGRLKHQST